MYLALLFFWSLFDIIDAVKAVPVTALVSNRARSEKKQNAALEGLKSGLASGISAGIVKMVLQPFDTIKTVQQIRNVKLSTFGAGAHLVKTRGVASLWSGIGVTVLGSSPSVAIYFGVYSAAKRQLISLFPPRFKLVAVALSASIGNTVASFIRVPYEVIKQRIQAGQHISIIEAFRHSLKTEGPLGLFSNGKLASQILRDVPYAICTLVSYEILQKKISVNNSDFEPAKANEFSSNVNKDSLRAILDPYLSRLKNSPRLRNALCGSLAGGIGSFLTTPMDMIKTRMMTGTHHASIADAIFSILREEGLQAFFIGTYPRLLHKIPANGLFFLCYEALRTMLGVQSSTYDTE